MSKGARLTGFFLHLALIFYSSTARASEFCEYTYGQVIGRLDLHAAAGVGTPIHGLARKSVHVLLFFSLGVWLYRSFQKSALWNMIATLVVSLAIGTASESLQLLYPRRQALVSDVILNFCCAGIGAAAAMLEARRRA